MKEGLHPELHEVTVTCACGNSWETRSTQPELKVDICSQCHPFFTGEQRIVDTAGQVERFMRRIETSQKLQEEMEARRRAKEERQQARILIEVPEEGEEAEEEEAESVEVESAEAVEIGAEEAEAAQVAEPEEAEAAEEGEGAEPEEAETTAAELPTEEAT